MGIECKIYPAFHGDPLLGRALRRDTPAREFDIHTVIVDATSIIQGSLINVEGGSFGRIKSAAIGSMVDLVKRYPNVSALAYLCDTSIRVPCAKSVEHTQERGRSAYTADELVAAGVLLPRYAEDNDDAPAHYELYERFPLEVLPADWNWKKAWHTAPTRRRMESTLGTTLLDAAASIRPHSERGWASARAAGPDFDDAHALGLADATHHAFYNVAHGRDIRTRGTGPWVYVDMTRPEAERCDVYAPLTVETGVDPRTGASITTTQPACIAWNDMQSHPMRRVAMGSGATIETLETRHGHAGEFDVRALEWISPAYGDGMVIYSDDSDMVPIVLLHLMRLECARLGAPLDAADVERYGGWTPRRVLIDRTCNAAVRKSDNETTCRAVDMTLMFSQLMYDCTHADGTVERAAWCARRISAFVLALVMCGTDYCPRLGSIFKRMHVPDDGVRRNPNLVLDLKECIHLAVRTPLLCDCILATFDPARGTLDVTVHVERMLFVVMQLTAQTVARAHKRGESLASLAPFHDAAPWDRQRLGEAWTLLHQRAVPPPAQCAYVSVPTFDVAWHQALRWMWNYFYWRDAVHDTTPYHVTRWMPVRGTSAAGWQLDRVRDAAEVNLLDISQYVFPLPHAGDNDDPAVWPDPTTVSLPGANVGHGRALAAWRTCRQYGARLCGEDAIVQFRKEASR